jgi:nitric oxide synthase-interacting protein
MGKHSKNNNERAFFSHAERQAAKYGRHSSGLLGGHNTAGGNFVDTGWGSHKRTLDSDAMKDLDACSLTLVPCVDPVITPKGVVYDKQVIYQYILDRKAEIERELRAWTAQQEAEAAGAASEAARAADQRVEEFVARQEGLSKSDLASRRPSDPSSSGGAVGALMGRTLVEDTGKHAADTSFWVPQLTPQSKSLLDKPDGVVRCPITNEPLKLKQLYPLSFTRADESLTSAETLAKPRNERYICPLSKKALSNTNPAAFLRPSGTVVSVSCVDSIIKKDMVDPFTDPPTRLKEKDIIPLRVEGTGFAAKTDEKALKVTKTDVMGF